MSEEIIGKCWHCGRELTQADYAREATCLGCGKSTRVCRNCRLYAPGRPESCAEPMAEPVKDKERANFCEHFDPSPAPAADGAGNSAEDLLKAAEALFK